MASSFHISPDQLLWRSFLRIQRLMRRRREESSIPREKIYSILLVELTRLGDVIEMIPAIRVFVRSYPLAIVHILIDTAYAPLMEAMNLGVIVHGVAQSTTIYGFVGAVREARRVHPDLAVSMSPVKRNALVSALCGAHAFIGYLSYVKPHGQYFRPVPVTALGDRLTSDAFFGREHIAQRSLRICEALGLNIRRGEEGLRFPDSSFRPVEQTLLQAKPTPHKRYVVVHPFSGWSYRTWPMERYRILADHLHSKLGYDVIFICAEEESSLLDSVRRSFEGNHAIRFFVSSHLTETLGLLQKADLFVGNDSGPLHLATLLGVPSVGLFGPAPPEYTAPVDNRNIYLFHKVECCPCEQVRCVRPHEPCIGLITPDEVVSAATRLLTQPACGEALKNA